MRLGSFHCGGGEEKLGNLTAAFKAPAEGTYQRAGHVPGLEEKEEDSWPLQSTGKCSSPRCVPAGPMAAPPATGCLEWL